MSKEKTINAGQVEIVVARGRQSLYPHVITCAESEQVYSDKEVLMIDDYGKEIFGFDPDDIDLLTNLEKK